jgi:uncharacterized protein YndB with AHSA1/START domain
MHTGMSPENAKVEPIRETTVVPLDPQRAFDLFTRQMEAWWPLDQYSRVVNERRESNVHVTRLEFQAELGGAILEHTSDGTVLPWGEVMEWDPPNRVVMAWRPHSEPEPPTELDVTFRRTEGGTTVETEHRGWERLSPGFREAMYDVYVRGWVMTLGRFAAAASRLS